ncbi:hypothetical protein Trydic_g1643 [Trypoxylus dichotomus]
MEPFGINSHREMLAQYYAYKKVVEENIPLSELRLRLLCDEVHNVVYEETDVENWNKDVVLNNTEQNEELDSESVKEAGCTCSV